MLGTCFELDSLDYFHMDVDRTAQRPGLTPIVDDGCDIIPRLCTRLCSRRPAFSPGLLTSCGAGVQSAVDKLEGAAWLRLTHASACRPRRSEDGEAVVPLLFR